MLNNALMAIGLLQEDGDRSVYFTDQNSVSPWAQDAVNHIAALGIVQGSGNGAFNPGDTLTYAEAASMVLKMLQQAGLIDK